jgi:hypothetical protein
MYTRQLKELNTSLSEKVATAKEMHTFLAVKLATAERTSFDLKKPPDLSTDAMFMAYIAKVKE